MNRLLLSFGASFLIVGLGLLPEPFTEKFWMVIIGAICLLACIERMHRQIMEAAE